MTDFFELLDDIEFDKKSISNECKRSTFGNTITTPEEFAGMVSQCLDAAFDNVKAYCSHNGIACKVVRSGLWAKSQPYSVIYICGDKQILIESTTYDAHDSVENVWAKIVNCIEEFLFDINSTLILETPITSFGGGGGSISSTEATSLLTGYTTSIRNAKSRITTIV